MKVLVTGSKGQLGSEINVLSSKFKDISFDFHDIDTLDLLNRKVLNKYFTLNKPDFIINCAAYTAVDKAESEKEKAFEGNCKLVANLVGECQKFNSKLIHISTDYVFDGCNYRPYSEEDSVNPQGEYGKTKLLGEQEALKYDRSIVIRTSWLYSSFGNNFVKTMVKLGKEKEELKVVFDQVGTPTYASDLANAILLIINKYKENPDNFFPGIYHYSNEGVCSWYDVAKEIMDIGILSCKILPIESKDYPTVAKRPHYSVLNKNKIKSKYKFLIPHWKDSLKTCLDLML